MSAISRHHMNQYISERKFIEKFLRDTYVDDNIIGEETVEAGFSYCLNAKEKMKEARFELQKWATNNPELSAMIKSCKNENSQCELVTEINVDDDSYTKACFGSDDQFKRC